MDLEVAAGAFIIDIISDYTAIALFFQHNGADCQGGFGAVVGDRKALQGSAVAAKTIFGYKLRRNEDGVFKNVLVEVSALQPGRSFGSPGWHFFQVFCRRRVG